MTAVERPKVFGIGLNKTGTISLHEALETLGFRSLHWGGPEVKHAVLRALSENRPLVDDLGPYDAYSDIEPLSQNFDVLHAQYPGARFVLTTRDVESWVDSRRRHVERNLRRQEQGLYHGNFVEVDEAAWREEHRRHHERVLTFFGARPGDLLVMSIVEGDGYEVLCPFLGVERPEAEFPWRHRDASADGAAGCERTGRTLGAVRDGAGDAGPPGARSA
jgi:hypothetical protein